MSKQVISILTCIFLAGLCMLILIGTATAATSVSILPSSQTVGPGENFTLEIYVRPDTTIRSLHFDLEYNGTLVVVNRINDNSFFAGDYSAIMFNPGSINAESGTVSGIYSSVIKGNGSSGEGVFCTVELTAGTNEGNCNFRMANVMLEDELGQKVPATIAGSQIDINRRIHPLASVTDILQKNGIVAPTSDMNRTSYGLIFVFAIIAFSTVAYFRIRKK